MDQLAKHIELYDRYHGTFDQMQPLEAISFRMQQLQIGQKELSIILGSKSRASEILRQQRRLSLDMIRKIYAALRIPADVLIRALPVF
jgi:HTH-type transcriptional regulator/antitoxin HigA